jgi:tetratricopeptide (TPR) repeat protein
VAVSLDNLGMLAMALGQRAQARAYLDEALDIWSKTAGPQKLDTMITLNRIATLTYQEGHPTEAEEMFKTVLKIRREKLPAVHPEIAESLEAYAEVLDRLNKHEQARESRSQASEIWKALKRVSA